MFAAVSDDPPVTRECDRSGEDATEPLSATTVPRPTSPTPRHQPDARSSQLGEHVGGARNLPGQHLRPAPVERLNQPSPLRMLGDQEFDASAQGRPASWCAFHSAVVTSARNDSISSGSSNNCRYRCRGSHSIRTPPRSNTTVLGGVPSLHCGRRCARRRHRADGALALWGARRGRLPACGRADARACAAHGRRVTQASLRTAWRPRSRGHGARRRRSRPTSSATSRSSPRSCLLRVRPSKASHARRLRALALPGRPRSPPGGS